MTSATNLFLQIALAVLWLLASGLLLARYLPDSSQFNSFGQGAGLLFLALIIVVLWRAPPRAADLPNLTPGPMLGLGYRTMLGAILAALIALFLLGIVFHPWLVLVIAFTLAAIGVIAKRRQSLSWRMIGLGLFIGALCLSLSGLSGRLDMFQAIHLACVPILFVGGVLLTQESGLTLVYCVDGTWTEVAKGLLIGCVLAVPAAFLNISYGAHSGDAWIDQPWEPIVALVPGFAEEIWARLFLLTAIYVLLRRRSNDRPTRVVLAAVFIAAAVHSLAHLPGHMVFSPAAVPMLLTALLYGVPMGLLFVKFGFEHAVGYHFFIDFVRFIAAFQASQLG